MGGDSLVENKSNAPGFICPICLPKPKSSKFQKKKEASLGVRSLYNRRTVMILSSIVDCILA